MSAGGEPIRWPRWRPIVEMVVVVRELSPQRLKENRDESYANSSTSGIMERSFSQFADLKSMAGSTCSSLDGEILESRND